MTRFLIAAPVRPGHAKNGLCVGQALQQLGHEVHFFDYSKTPFPHSLMPKPLRSARWEAETRSRINEMLLAQVKQWRPDVFFCVKGVQLDRTTIVEIGRLGVQTAGYWIDDPLDHHRSLVNAGAYHLYLSNDRNSVADYRRAGLSNVHYYPSAVDDTHFHPLTENHPGPAISFVGTLSERRLAVLREIADMDVDIYGPGWIKNSGLCRHRCRLHKQAFGNAVNRIFNTSRINLNIHNWFGQGSAMNLRLFEVPAAGGFLLTDWVEEIDEHFVEDEHVVCWRSVDELRSKADWYLKHEPARQRIAQAGYQHVMHHHTYEQRARTLLDLLKRT